VNVHHLVIKRGYNTLPAQVDTSVASMQRSLACSRHPADPAAVGMLDGALVLQRKRPRSSREHDRIALQRQT